MILNLLYCLILRQLCIYRILNKIIYPSNNFCIKITLISIPRFHRSSTNISPHPFTLKKISHHATSIWIILFIQPHTHILKWIISFSSHNKQTKKTRMQNKGKWYTKLQKGQQNTKLQKLNEYPLEIVRSL